MGDYNTGAAKMLVIKFDVCRDPEGTPLAERKCKDEAEIMAWINRRFIKTLENQITFQK